MLERGRGREKESPAGQPLPREPPAAFRPILTALWLRVNLEGVAEIGATVLVLETLFSQHLWPTLVPCTWPDPVLLCHCVGVSGRRRSWEGLCTAGAASCQGRVGAAGDIAVIGRVAGWGQGVLHRLGLSLGLQDV